VIIAEKGKKRLTFETKNSIRNFWLMIPKDLSLRSAAEKYFNILSIPVILMKLDFGL